MRREEKKRFRSWGHWSDDKPSAGYLYTYRIGKSVYSDIAMALVHIVGVLQGPIGAFVFGDIRRDR